MSDKVENRNRAVLDAALLAAQGAGYRQFTRQHVASLAGVSCGSVNNAYGTMDALRDAVMAAAVDRGNLAVLAQGLADAHPAACAAPPDMKERALARLAA